MDNLKDIFSNLFERIRSPFYSTFIVSWLVVNWRILFLAFSDDIETSEKIDKIAAQLTTYSNSIGWPLGIALSYFFIYRWLEVLAALYINWQKAVRQDRELKQLKKHVVSGTEYFDLVAILDEQNNIYSKLKSEKAKVDTELNVVKRSLEESNRNVMELQKQVENSASYSNQTNLIGDWTMTTRKIEADNLISEQVKIRKTQHALEFEVKVKGGANRLGTIICFQNYGDNISFVLVNDGAYMDMRLNVNSINNSTSEFLLLEGFSNSNNDGLNYSYIKLERNL